MRKLLLALILCILLVVSVLFIVKGISNSKFEIYGVNQIKEKNAEIDLKNGNLAMLVNQDYPLAAKNVEAASTQMKKTKEEYEEKASLLGNSKYYMQTEEYKLEFLWTKLGNYADDENVDIKIDVTNSQMSGRYNLNFTVTGAYTDVTQFIYDVENDSKLGFKIENFGMISKETETYSGVEGKFSCKDIKIDLKDIQTEANENNEETEETSKKGTSSSTSDKNTKTNTSSSSKSTNTTKNTNTTVDNNTTRY